MLNVREIVQTNEDPDTLTSNCWGQKESGHILLLF